MLLQSDVARLVLGYLAEENYSLTYKTFLDECTYLKSVRYAFDDVSDTAPTTIFGKSLLAIIDEYFHMKDAEMRIWNFKNRRPQKSHKLLNVWKKLEEALAAVKSYQIASIMDGLQMNKSYCKNCENAMTQNGVVITPATPTTLLCRNKPPVNRSITNDVTETSTATCRGEPGQNLSSSLPTVSLLATDDVCVTPVSAGLNYQCSIPSSPATSISAIGNDQLLHTKENRRKKNRGIPKRLSDIQRKDKESELSVDQPSRLLQTITGSETMAVVGATIMSHMKKCTQTEKTPNKHLTSSSFDVDADAAKHNQKSIVELSLESLLASDFTLSDIELGKEFEELLGNHDKAFTDFKQDCTEVVQSQNSDIVPVSQSIGISVRDTTIRTPPTSPSVEIAVSKFDPECTSMTNSTLVRTEPLYEMNLPSVSLASSSPHFMALDEGKSPALQVSSYEIVISSHNINETSLSSSSNSSYKAAKKLLNSHSSISHEAHHQSQPVLLNCLDKTAEPMHESIMLPSHKIHLMDTDLNNLAKPHLEHETNCLNEGSVKESISTSVSKLVSNINPPESLNFDASVNLLKNEVFSQDKVDLETGLTIEVPQVSDFRSEAPHDVEVIDDGYTVEIADETISEKNSLLLQPSPRRSSPTSISPIKLKCLANQPNKSEFVIETRSRGRLVSTNSFNKEDSEKQLQNTPKKSKIQLRGRLISTNSSSEEDNEKQKNPKKSKMRSRGRLISTNSSNEEDNKKQKTPASTWNESPAKNTRSRTKQSKSVNRKSKTPRVVIKTKNSERKRASTNKNTKSIEKKEKLVKKKKTQKKSQRSLESNEKQKSPLSKQDSHISDLSDISPVNTLPKTVLAAVRLQSKSCSPRKLTLRYGLRSTEIESNHSSSSLFTSASSSPHSTISTSSCTISSNHRDNLCLRDVGPMQNCSLISSTPAEADKKIECAAGDLEKMQNINQQNKVSLSMSSLQSCGPGPDVAETDEKIKYDSVDFAEMKNIIQQGKASLSTPSVQSCGLSSYDAKADERIKHSTAGLSEMQNIIQQDRAPISRPSGLSCGPNPSLTNKTILLSSSSEIPSASIVVPNYDNVEMSTILQQLTDQIRKSKTSSSLTTTAKYPQDVEESAVDTSFTANDPSSILHEGEEIPSYLLSKSGGNASDHTRLISVPPHPSENSENFEDRLSSLSKKSVTGESLTVLLNETSLTQMLESVKNDKDYDWGFSETFQNPKTIPTDFKTISPPPGVFSVLDSVDTKPEPLVQSTSNSLHYTSTFVADRSLASMCVVCTQPSLITVNTSSVPLPTVNDLSDTDPAVQQLRGWLNNSNVKEDFKPQRKQTVCRTLDFLHPVALPFKQPPTRRPLMKKQSRKLLPKLSSKSTNFEESITQSTSKQSLHFKEHSAGRSSFVLNQSFLQNTSQNYGFIRILGGSSYSTPVLPSSCINLDPVVALEHVSPLSLGQKKLENEFNTNEFYLKDNQSDILQQALVATGVTKAFKSEKATVDSLQDMTSYSCVQSDMRSSPLTGSKQVYLRISSSCDTTLTTYSNISPRCALQSSDLCAANKRSPITPVNTSLVPNVPAALSNVTNISSGQLSFTDILATTSTAEISIGAVAPNTCTSPNSSSHLSSQHQPKNKISTTVTSTSYFAEHSLLPTSPSTKTVVSTCSQKQVTANYSSDNDIQVDTKLRLESKPTIPSTIRDPAEKRNSKLITSEENEIKKQLLPKSHKRKSSRNSASPKKKRRLDKLKRTSMSDLVAFLKKIHGQDQSKENVDHHSNEETNPHSQSSLSTRSKSTLDSPNVKKQECLKSDEPNDCTQKASTDKPKKHEPKKWVSPLNKIEKKKKRRVSLTSIPIPASKLGGSPLHLRTPSPPVRIFRDSPKTIAQVAESLVELSRSGSSFDASLPLSSFTLGREETVGQQSGDAVLQTTKPSPGSSSSKKASHKKKKARKKHSLDNLNISEFLSTIKYD